MTVYPTISDNIAVQAAYLESRRLGESHSIAEMLALRQLPGVSTDRELFAGRGTLADQFKGEEHVLEQLSRKAAANGRKPQYTDLYEPSLAAYPGDPEAFIPASGGRSHIAEVCRRRGWACDGTVKVKASGPSIEERKNQRQSRPNKKGS